MSSTQNINDSYNRIPQSKVKETGRGNVSRPAFPVAAVRVPDISINKSPAVIVSPVQSALNAYDADAQISLTKLRDIVVGPAQQLNEARLEELIQLFEEREESLHAALREMQKQNMEFELTLNKTLSEKLNFLKTEFLSITENVLDYTKRTATDLSQEIANCRNEASLLVADTKSVVTQKIDALETYSKSALDQKSEQLQVEMGRLHSTQKSYIESKGRASHIAIGRLLKEAGESLARESGSMAG